MSATRRAKAALRWIAWALLPLVGLASAVALGAIWRDATRASVEHVPEAQVENRPIAVGGDGYVGSDTCRSCHPHHHATWHASHHRTMTQPVSDESVIADFDDRTLHAYGQEFRFYREDGGFFMEMKPARTEPSAPGRTFELVLSTGAHHQQAFWYATDEGRSLGKLPFIWINAEQRWVPYGSIFFAPPSRPSMQTGVWNQTCIKCHVVSGRPRFDEDSGYDSHVGEFGISCGACHGPAEEHAAIHRNPLHRYRQHFSSADDPTLVSAADLDHRRSSQVCGQCHSTFELLDAESEQAFDRHGFAFRPGDDLHASRHVFRVGQDEDHPVVARKLESSPRYFERRFWSDGMVRVSGREYNGLLETPCYQQGTLSCLSCHSMHPGLDDERPRAEWADDQLRPGMRDNQACVQCHEVFADEERLVAHTHHAPRSSGSNCYNCHMPHTTLGLMKAMRSHTVDSPDVATNLSTGRPNACNLCHLDQTLAWTADHLAARYGISRPELGDDDRRLAASVRWVLEGDAGQRGIAAWHYGWEPAQRASGTRWMAPFLAELLTDRYDVVRFIGYHALRELPGFADFEYDYVGPATSRQERRLAARRSWYEQAERPAPSDALFIDSRGGLFEARVRDVRGRRLDPPVVLAE